MSYRGDIRLGDTIDVKFTTRRFSTGAPFTLAGTPAVAAYVGNGTTEITAGITLTVDFDGRTGLHNVRVVASSGNGFATATNVYLVITAGTVDGVSVVGEVIGSFSIENRSALMPTTAGNTLVVANGCADADIERYKGTAVPAANSAGTPVVDVVRWEGNVVEAAATPGRPHIHAVSVANDALTAAALATDAVNEIRNAITGGAYSLSTDANGRMRIVDGTAAGELDTTSGLVTLADGSLSTAKFVDGALTGAKFGSTFFDDLEVSVGVVVEFYKLHYLLNEALPSPLDVADNSIVALLASKAAGDAVFSTFDHTTDALEAQRDNVGAAGANLTIAAVTGAVGSVTGNVGGNVTGSVGSVAGNVAGSVASVVGNVGGAVNGVIGNVTGNIGGSVIGSVGTINGISAAAQGHIRDAVGLAAANLDAQLDALPTATEIRNAITGGAYALSTDANGRIRIVDGTGAGELDTNGGAIASVLALGAQAKLDVNAEVVDALNVDSYAEPAQGTPPATASLAVKLNWLFAAWRNKKTQDSGELKLFADDLNTVLAKSLVSEALGVSTFGEWATGA